MQLRSQALNHAGHRQRRCSAPQGRRRTAQRSGHRKASAARRVSVSVAAANKGVVILPGLGNNSEDYRALAASLQRRHFDVEIADVARVDWLRNAAGLLDAAYWSGTLKPRPTVDWYLNKVLTPLQFLVPSHRSQFPNSWPRAGIHATCGHGV
jgi:hypothetical protein